MKLIKPDGKQIPLLVDLSRRAFHSDCMEVVETTSTTPAAGAPRPGGPPGYDSIQWHIQRMTEGHLFAAVDGEEIIGGAILFLDQRGDTLYIGRIFVDPTQFRRGYGSAIMREIETLYPAVSTFRLETPLWNTRTNQFYQKIGYQERYRTEEEVFYEKVK